MNENNEDKNQFHLRYLTLPVEVFLNKNLDKTSLLLFPVIDLLDNSWKHCFASNQYLARILNTSERNITASMSLLIEQKYVDQVSFNGRKRIVKINKDFLETYKNLREESDDRTSAPNYPSGQPRRTDQSSKNNDNNDTEGRTAVRGCPEQEFGHIKDNIKVVESMYQNTSCSVRKPRTADLHPRKKILINKSVPLVIEEDKPDHPDIKPHVSRFKKVLVPKKSDDVLDIMEYWAEKGFHLHQEKTLSEAKAVKDIYALLDGTLFDSFKNVGYIRKYRVSEVKKAIDNLAIAAFNKDYQPSTPSYKDTLRRIGLCHFFYDASKGTETNKSLFLRYLFTAPKLISESAYLVKEDKYPAITKLLADWYHQKFSDRTNDSVQNINAFITASEKLNQYLIENKDKLRLENFHMMYGCYDNFRCLAVQLTRTMDKELRNNDTLWRDFHPGWLTTENTFANRLTKFLKSESMMK